VGDRTTVERILESDGCVRANSQRVASTFRVIAWSLGIPIVAVALTFTIFSYVVVHEGLRESKLVVQRYVAWPDVAVEDEAFKWRTRVSAGQGYVTIYRFMGLHRQRVGFGPSGIDYAPPPP
jgi:hypothetical protein